MAERDRTRLDATDEAELRGYIENGEHNLAGLGSDYLVAVMDEVDILRELLAGAEARTEDARRWAVRLEQHLFEERQAAYDLLRAHGSLLDVASSRPLLLPPMDIVRGAQAAREAAPERSVVVARVRIENWVVNTAGGKPYGHIDCQIQVDQEDLVDLVALLEGQPARLFLAGSYPDGAT